MTTSPAAKAPKGSRESYLSLFTPKLLIMFRAGYRLADLRGDILAGLTVAVVALPLAMALAIASGTTPDKGLITVVVAGLVISLLGGSRVQIGGPTGAFVVIVFGIIEQYGYADLVLATFMAGVILMAAGFARVGAWIKYIPQPVISGFTAGIAVIIASSQLKDFFGIEADVPADFLEKLRGLWSARATADFASLGIAGGALLFILAQRRWLPKLPGFLIAAALAALAVGLVDLPVTTIGSAFGGIPNSLPLPALPEGITLERLERLLPSAFTIAFLAGLESLLSAMVADGMTGHRHRSHMELVAQGAANAASALFGGLPATGAIARTATNIRAGGKSPVAGIAHALFVLAFMLLLAPLAAFIPLAALSAILLIVAWSMSEPHRVVRILMRAPWGEKLVLLVTFLLTVLADLTVAIEVGVVLAAILFMHRMAETVRVESGVALFEEDMPEAANAGLPDMRRDLPEGVEVYQIQGPLFFGVAGRLTEILDRLPGRPKVFIVRMGQVPYADATGIEALSDLNRRARASGIALILSGLNGQPLKLALVSGLLEGEEAPHRTDGFAEAIRLARDLIGEAS